MRLRYETKMSQFRVNRFVRVQFVSKAFLISTFKPFRLEDTPFADCDFRYPLQHHALSRSLLLARLERERRFDTQWASVDGGLFKYNATSLIYVMLR